MRAGHPCNPNPVRLLGAGDVNWIEIGTNTNVQDNVVVHVAKHSIDGKPAPTKIGNNCTIGHCATIHAATVGDNCLIGMGATLLDGSSVGAGSIVAAGAVVTPRTAIPSGQVRALRSAQQPASGAQH